MDRQLHDQLPAYEGVSYRRPTVDDCVHIIRNMRRSDIRELLGNPLNANKTLRDIVFESIDVSSQAWVACMNDIPFIMFGCAYSNNVGFPWLFGTDAMTKHAMKISREAPRWLSLFSNEAAAMMNVFDTRNTVHIAWAKKLGFAPYMKINDNYQMMVKYV